MANHALFIGWTRAHAGKEEKAMEYFQTGLSYWSKQKEAGMIEDFEPVILTSHGGDLNGFILVKGDRDKLHELRWKNDEFTKLNLQWSSALEGYGVIDCYAGEGLKKIMQDFEKIDT